MKHAQSLQAVEGVETSADRREVVDVTNGKAGCVAVELSPSKGDHDYFDNDEAWDEIVTFPPVWFQLELARATQRLYYPEFLPDENRPRGLPWGSVGDRTEGVSESWGTVRFGRLAEILLYDVRRTCTLARPSAVFIDPEVERWLLARTAAKT